MTFPLAPSLAEGGKEFTKELSMEIIRAKTAGFCFGVDRAVKLTYNLLARATRWRPSAR